MDARLQRVLARVPGWSAAHVVATPLGGGITNRNYRVEVGGEAFVLRIGGEGTDLLGIDRRNEHAASVVAAELGIGAEVVLFLPEECALITRFISGKGITPEAARETEMLRRIVDSIRRFHSGPPFPGVFSPFDTVRGYRELALKHGVAFPPTLPLVLDGMAKIERAVMPAKANHPKPCHNDLLAGNFIDDGCTIRVLDWEYAGMGDPFFDLGNFAVNQQLSGKQCEMLLRLYFGSVRRKDLARLHLMRCASDLRESFWGFLQSGVSRLDFDFSKYARDHLDRFLENIALPEFPQWLEEAAM